MALHVLGGQRRRSCSTHTLISEQLLDAAHNTLATLARRAGRMLKALFKRLACVPGCHYHVGTVAELVNGENSAIHMAAWTLTLVL